MDSIAFEFGALALHRKKDSDEENTHTKRSWLHQFLQDSTVHFFSFLWIRFQSKKGSSSRMRDNQLLHLLYFVVLALCKHIRGLQQQKCECHRFAECAWTAAHARKIHPAPRFPCFCWCLRCCLLNMSWCSQLVVWECGETEESDRDGSMSASWVCRTHSLESQMSPRRSSQYLLPVSRKEGKPDSAHGVSIRRERFPNGREKRHVTFFSVPFTARRYP